MRMNVDENLSDSRQRAVFEPDLKQRHTSDRQQTFGDGIGEGAQPSTASGGKNKGLHGIFRLASGLPSGKRLLGDAHKSPLGRAVLILVDEWIVDQNSRPAEVKSKTHSANPVAGKHLAHCRLLVFVAVQQ